MPQIGIGVDASQSTIDMSEDFTVVEQMRTNFNSKGINTGLNINWTIFEGMGMFAAKHSLELLAAQSDNQVEIIIEQTVEELIEDTGNETKSEEATGRQFSLDSF